MDNGCAAIDSILDSLAAMADIERRHYMKHDYCQPTATARSPILSGQHRISSDSSSSTNDSSMKNSMSSTSLQDVQDIHQLQLSQSQTPQPSDSSPFRFWRHQMIDWATVVVDSFELDRELVAISMNLLDRYVVHELSKSKAAPITRDDFQLFSMTCLYLAIKMNEPYPRKLGIQSLVNMSRGFYSEADVVLTELDLLKGLKYHVNPPTSTSFVKLLLEIFPQELQTTRMRHTAVTLTELAMTSGTMIGCKESLVGLASILYAARMDNVAEGHLQEFLARVAPAVPVQNDADYEFVYSSLLKAYGF
jgi:hypothetical protein